jgi:hypothetical protein
VKIQHARPLAQERVNELCLGYTSVGIGSGFWIHFEIYLFAQLWVKIQHACPLAHERMNEFWLGYTPVGTGCEFRIHFEILGLDCYG